MNRYEILTEAHNAVLDRGKNYGDARDNFERIAAMWTTMLGVRIQAHQVSAMMIAVKLARLHNDPAHRDSMIDIAGYAALWSECIGEETPDN